jgi:hypothetical protein
MTLNKLLKVDQKAFKAWVVEAPPGTLALSFQTTRAYKVNGKLFLIWNNGLFYELFKFNGKKWISLSNLKGNRSYRSKVYARGCKVLAYHDRSRLYG